MPQKFKNPSQQANALRLASRSKWDGDNLAADLYTSLRTGGEKEYPQDFKNNEANVRSWMAKRLTELYDLDDNYAQILVDGAMSRLDTQKNGEIGKSYGIYESTPFQDWEAEIKTADELLKNNPEAYGVVYGYTNDKAKYKLKNPIFVKDMQDLDRYQNAIGKLGKSSLKTFLQARFKGQGD